MYTSNTDEITLDIPTQWECSPVMALDGWTDRRGDPIADLVDVSQVAQHVFGRLVETATDPSSGNAVKTYHSDFWHDAKWIGQYMTGDRFEFWFGFDESGTGIGTDSLGVQYRTVFYRVTVEIREHRLGAKAFMTMARVVRPEGWRK